MAGAFPVAPQVVGRRRKCASEVILPEAVDDDSRGQRILSVRDPTRQQHFRLRRVGRLVRGAVSQQNTGDAHAHRFQRFRFVATLQEMNRRPSRCVRLNAEQRGNRCRQRLLESPNLLLDFLPLSGGCVRDAILPFINPGVDPVRCLFPLGPELPIDERCVVFVRRSHKGLQPIVVLLAERVVKVIVTAGAANRQAEEYRPDRVRHLGEDFIPAEGNLRIPGVASNGTESVKTRCD